MKNSTCVLSWNVNGIRAVQKKGFLNWLEEMSPEILCVQETKAQPDQLDEILRNPPGYHGFFNSAQRKGYSGVATFTKEKPLKVQPGLGILKFDVEGRVLLTEFQHFILLNIYFPNGKRDEERLKYKLDFYEETLGFVQKLKKDGKPVIICGDYNTAHQPIDLARPKANEKISGFLPVERAWLDRWVEDGQVDIFRKFCSLPDQYTWWDMQTRARDRNVGWRIDYHFVSENFISAVKNATILSNVMGSDHCPVSIELDI